MSRIITIKSNEIIEIDLANEVIEEMREQGHSRLTFNEESKQFTNQQYDDIKNNTIDMAMQLYGSKLQELNLTKAEGKLKKNGYKTRREIEKTGEIKIIAEQNIYA